MRAFDFGANWQVFSEKLLDQTRLQEAKQSIQALLDRNDLGGYSVLDVGCGSGLFSIAASQLHAHKVTGIDINPRCLAVTQRNQEILTPDTKLHLQEISALDQVRMQSLGKFNLVYAWGSLHHTGAMWDAIRNTATTVDIGGSLVLAIYNKHITSPIWTVIKFVYNRLPKVGQLIMSIVFAIVIYVAKLMVTRKNPLNKERGMSFWYDVIDWIGGYPYEYASIPEIRQFVEPLGFTLVKVVPAQVPTGCNEFVFVRN